MIWSTGKAPLLPYGLAVWRLKTLQLANAGAFSVWALVLGLAVDARDARENHRIILEGGSLCQTATSGILQYAHIIKCLLVGVELGVPPQGFQFVKILRTVF